MKKEAQAMKANINNYNYYKYKTNRLTHRLIRKYQLCNYLSFNLSFIYLI